ncbi:MAG: hypothetical protein D6B25_04930 [Desulfobulbaceae bacterium]|nr:MAG: hypothetical protein D6B25_04930 [Desulfobulbaceae bacterium]
MLAFFNTITRRVAILCMTTALITIMQTNKSRADTLIKAHLHASFDIANQQINGEMKLLIPPDTPLTLFVKHLETRSLETTPASETDQIDETAQRIDFGVQNYHRSLRLHFKKRISDSFYNSISEDAIVLTSGWHPVPDVPVLFSLSVDIPDDFLAISETDRIEERQAGEPVRFSFSRPQNSLNLAAAPWVKRSLKIRDNLTLHTLFFEQDDQLAQDYLESAARFIKRYEALIGPYPYHHYVIVENLMPTGFGMPGFTLLGQQILRLPFIKTTSLGHEILHSWFGHHIGIAEDSGNWVEGLTSYLADMAYRQDAGDGTMARKEVIQNYLNYVKEDTPPLGSFYAPGQHSIADKDLRAVGYGRSSMLFHEVRKRIGEQAFRLSLQQLYKQFGSQLAGWRDLQHLFEVESSTSLDQLFTQHLERTDLPVISIEELNVNPQTDHTELSFTIVQQNEQPYELLLPLIVKTLAGDRSFTRLIKDQRTAVTLPLDSHPLQLVVDPEYDTMRNLTIEEKPPVLSQLLGSPAVLVVVNDPDNLGPHQPFVDFATQLGWEIVSADSITQVDLIEKEVVFLGTSNLARGIFGLVVHPDTGFTIDIRKNPLALHHLMVLVASSSAQESATALRKLRHYGNYSFLHFISGRLEQKRKTAAMEGLHTPIDNVPDGVNVSTIDNFSTLVDAVSQAQVIYIGENHTSKADHLLQQMLIEAIYQRDNNIVIGMEMFPSTSQDALDRYINDPQVLETDFLKESRYFEVWRYDYRLFRPIFAFARKHQIPVIGLNIERAVVSDVFKTGIIEERKPTDKNRVPVDRHLDLPGYTERLLESYQGHTRLSLSSNGGTPAGFIQAQSLWDETMAESIVHYLQEHPEKKMIVLAGTQHTRNDSGIPPRVTKRAPYQQVSILNLASSSLSGDELVQTIDYGFYLNSGDLTPLGKIGVVLEQTRDDLPPGMKINEIMEGSRAAAAGLQVNDILIEIAGFAIREMDDVFIAMVGRLAGEEVEMTVMREGAGEYSSQKVTVVLYQPAPRKPHP